MLDKEAFGNARGGEMKAYRMTEYEVWAANSIEEAIADYRREILDDLDADV